ncbi:amino acid ABC transporter substrate-binding protein [Jeongeupella avenae]|uniref:Amino acid ABC transporter substrate-binding protein n=1 Tax=Antarcticirhabdus aurantiaca TaxID=2606717 RepID=A0ACD4NNC3_9HYPH|nr:amino acid ABC transporter substrate-binding protein [Antarcticirhabdus aurantiaca]WAJ28380.1 amino acid ABC transporter substrate-binding protein [Jeongeuplla avenae]
MNMNRRTFVGAAATAILACAAAVPPAIAQERSSVRIGYVVSQTGVNAAGATTTTIPNYELWVHDVNAAGGLRLPDGTQLPIEVVAYDDRSQTEEVVRGIERLVNQDRVDFILAPWGTGFNLAAAPLMARFGYPQIASSSIVPPIPGIHERWPGAFWLLGTAEDYAHAFAELLTTQKQAGALNGRIAMISIADGFGIELAASARKAFEEAGIEIVMDRTYPLGTQDFATLLSEAQASGADAFVAYSYPGDTFAITRQARVSGYNPPIFHTGVGTSFPIYPQMAEGGVEGVMSLGGIDVNRPEIQDYIRRHQEVIGKLPDAWASPVIYSSLQMLAQAIERRGLDREAVTQELASGRFETILGPIQLVDNAPRDLWYIGQWQGDHFVAVAPAGREGSADLVVPKPGWN